MSTSNTMTAVVTAAATTLLVGVACTLLLQSLRRTQANLPSVVYWVPSTDPEPFTKCVEMAKEVFTYSDGKMLCEVEVVAKRAMEEAR